jgi:3-oxoacyl-(acyl-carrier-protein) synthase
VRAGGAWILTTRSHELERAAIIDVASREDANEESTLQAREGSPPRLTKAHVRAINDALAQLHATATHGRIELIVRHDRLDELHLMWSRKLRDGEPDDALSGR